MKVRPQITVDFEEYPELKTLAEQAIRRVVELMEIHDIASIKRYRKTGVFDHPYVKDSVVRIGVPSVPDAVAAARDNVGSALLDYLETIGLSGMTLELTQEDVAAVSTLWTGRQPVSQKPNKTAEGEDEPVPHEVADTQGSEKQEAPAKEGQDSAETEHEHKPKKDEKNGQAKD